MIFKASLEDSVDLILGWIESKLAVALIMTNGCKLGQLSYHIPKSDKLYTAG
jgi:hypothetical protein